MNVILLCSTYFGDESCVCVCVSVLRFCMLITQVNLFTLWRILIRFLRHLLSLSLSLSLSPNLFFFIMMSTKRRNNNRVGGSPCFFFVLFCFCFFCFFFKNPLTLFFPFIVTQMAENHENRLYVELLNGTL